MKTQVCLLKNNMKSVKKNKLKENVHDTDSLKVSVSFESTIKRQVSKVYQNF